MTWLQSPRSKYSAVAVGSVVLGFLIAWPVFATGQDKKDLPTKPAVTADKTADANKELADQIRQMNATVARLEAALKQDPKAAPAGAPDKGGQADKVEGVPPGKRISAKFQNCIQCHQKRPSGPLPPDHLEMAEVSNTGAKQDDKTGTGDNKTPADGKAGMGDNKTPTDGKAGMGDKGMGMGMGMMGGKGMMDGKGKGMMGMMGGKEMGMGMMEEKKVAGMGKMDEKKGMAGMGGGKTGTGGATTGTMDQQRLKMLELKMQMLELKMEMMEKGAGPGTDQTAPETGPAPHAGHTGTPPGTPEESAKVGAPDKTPDPGKLADKPADAEKDLLAEVRELQARIAKLEAASKQGPK